MNEWHWFFLTCGFVLGTLCMALVVVVFWSYETHKYRRRYMRPKGDEHASQYQRRAG